LPFPLNGLESRSWFMIHGFLAALFAMRGSASEGWCETWRRTRTAMALRM
jgi:hypothetical protein